MDKIVFVEEEVLYQEYYEKYQGLSLVALVDRKRELQNVVGSVSNGSPFRDLFFGIDHLIRSVAKQKLRLHIPVRTGDHKLPAEFLQEGGGFQRTLKVPSDRYEADVEAVDPQSPEKGFVRAVADLRVRHEGKNVVDPCFVLVHGHDLVPIRMKLFYEQRAEAVHADKQNRFHKRILR